MMRRPVLPTVLLLTVALALLALFGAMPGQTARAAHVDPPTNLTKTAQTDTSITVSWDAPADQALVTHYRIRWKLSSASTFSNQVASPKSDGTSREITGLTAGTSYDIEVHSCEDSGCGHRSTTGVSLTASTNAAPAQANYDTDGDGLIEISSLGQLNAVRWDLDGDGSSTDAGYATAFPVAADGSVCPSDTTCTGYELTANLDFDENGDGQITSADATYWDNRLGWLPISTDASRFTATFDGGGYTIANLYVRRQGSSDAGLFGAVGADGRVRNLRLTNANVEADLRIGALAGSNYGAIANASAVGTVEGLGQAGGLVGLNQGAIERSYAGGSVDGQLSGSVGGLVGQNSGRIRASYAFAHVTNDSASANNAGGLVGLNSGSNAGIVASYATGTVAGTGNSGGLVGNNQSGASIVASYATGRVTGTGGNVGGLVGRNGGGTITASYYDTETSGRASDTGAQTTAALQTPTGYTGIYAGWNVDVDGVTGGDMPWAFPTTSQNPRYPLLSVDFNGDGTATWQEFGSQAHADQDRDGLMEIRSLAQLNAVRWDLDGDGVPADSNATDYETAFSLPAGVPGCPAGRDCTGYELMADLDFDENSDGQITAADAAYWNDGAGWATIGDAFHGYYDAAFDGNGHTISNLFINLTTTNREDVGLFGGVTSSGSVRDLGLVNVSVTGLAKTGALAGTASGAITGVYVSGQVKGTTKTGGLVGQFNTTNNITASYSAAAVSGTTDVGGLVGDLGAAVMSSVIDSYATGPVSGSVTVGGLVGNVRSNGVVTTSYATGPVSGSGNLGGLVGYSTGAVTDSYYDTDTSGRRGGAGPKTTADLQSPTDATGIYATWSTDNWHFGTNSQYPALKADFNDADNTASWPEFGYQIRDGLALTLTDETVTAPTITWTTPTTPNEWDAPTIAYRVYRNGASVVDSQPETAHSDSGLMEGPEYAYQVAALVNGVEQRRGNFARVGGYDTDGDGLIAITNLAQLNAIRYDLNGDGVVDDGVDMAGQDAYAAAFPSGGQPVCPAGRNCAGYELLNNLDFDTGTAGDRTDDTYHNSGSGWQPIGKDTPANDSVRYNAVFDGNRNTIANLFISRGGANDVGLFGTIGTAGVVRNLGVVDASVTAQRYVGALAGSSYGSISTSYSSGTVSGSNSFIGGLVGWNGGPISHSYAAAAVNSGDSTVGGLVGENHQRIIASYATGPITGRIIVGGLVGNNNAREGSNGEIIASYATGPVTGYTNVGGLLGQNESGKVIGSYATGPVVGTGATNVGGLAGNSFRSDFDGNYYDSETTGRVFGVGSDDDDPASNTDQDTDDNNVLDPGESFRDGVEAKTTAELQAPTAYGVAPAIYADWRNIDLNDDGMNDPEDTNDFWDFGTTSQYPALKADFNGDDIATWPEFGVQLRQPLRLTATLSADAMRVALGWNAPAVPAELGITTAAYALYRNGVRLDSGPAAGATSFQDSIDLTMGSGASYQVVFLLDGREAARSNLARVGGHDRDGDGLIEISTLAQLNAVRYDLDGNGEPDFLQSQQNIDAFEAAFDLPDGGLICRDISACAGYELTANLDFDTDGDGSTHTDGESDSGDDYHNDGAGWLPIGDDSRAGMPMPDSVRYNAVFEGNGHTIANLFIKSDTTDFYGVFGVIGTSGAVRNLGVVDVNISGTSWTIGALAGRNDGAITNSYATGSITGAGGIGGLVGMLTGSIADSYASATVAAGDSAGGLVGAASERSTITRSYATGSVEGRSNIGGLAGHVGHITGRATPHDGVITSSYATGAVTAFNSRGGGLVGYAEDARIVASYATGPVTGPVGETGGLVSLLDASASIIDSYYDTETAGQHGGVGPQTTSELQTPTGATGIYANWNADDWDFGTASQYPAIKSDFNGDTTASWPEFGYQVRDGLRLTATDSIPTASLSWTASTAPAQWSSPTVAYRVYRNAAAVVDSQPGTTHTDSGLMEGPEYAYQVAVLVNGVEQRRGNIVRIGGYDTDGDGLIAIENLEQLNAIRWDLDGDGVPSSGNATDYAAAFPSGEGTVCPAGRTCAGYELMADLDFDENGDGAITAADATYWNGGMGWEPIGKGLSTYSGTLEGNGHTISNLFIGRSGSGDTGLFGLLGGTVRNLGLVNVGVAGGAATGALVGDGGVGSSILSSYATGRVSGTIGVGGLVGRHHGSVSASYAAVSITATGDGAGGLVGRLEEGASVTASYATGAVSGTDHIGGLVGSMEPHTAGNTTVTASYATGPVSGRDHVGGLVGSNLFRVGGVDVSGTITASYHDAETSGVAAVLGDGPAGTAAAQTTTALQSPTDATGIYADWSADVWDFGTASQYPALKADFSDADSIATWPEFGYQVRDGLALTATASIPTASLAWTPPATLPSQWGSPAVTYQVYRNGAALGDPQAGQTYTDTGLTDGPEYAYQVAVLLDGVEARRSNVARIGGYDQDGDGLIEIRTLAQLNAIRWDVDGDGMPTDDPATTGFDETTLYAQAFPNGGRPICPAGQTCTGYELLADLDFDTDGDGATHDNGLSDSGDAYHNGGAGWDPIGDSSNQFSAEFQGNGHTIANLYVFRPADTYVGLFGVIDNTAVIRQVGVTNALVSGQDLTGALLGASLRGQVHDSYATGTVLGSGDGTGGLVGGFQGGELTGSYASASVRGDNQVGGLVGNVGTGSTTSRLTAVYAAGPVTGTGDDVGGLVGRLDARGVVTAAYATGTVTGTGDNVGGLVGNLVVEGSNAGTITASYYDTETSGQHGGHGAQTTAALQGPTDATGIYANWRNIDLDGDGMADPEDTNDFWHFGTGSQYPALKIDFNGDNAATWPEFGFQIRDGLALTQTNDSLTDPDLSWTQSTTPPEWGAPTIAYRVYRNGVAAVDSQIGTTHSDSGLMEGPEYAYQVAALLDGVELRRGNIVRIGGHDTDGDGLIAIANLGQLDAIRYDLDGDGVASSGNETAYAAAFPSGDGTVCPAGRKCAGYELMADLDFNNANSYAGGAVNTAWTAGTGWTPIAGGLEGYAAILDGNGHTIADLFINAAGLARTGLFGRLAESSSVRDLGLVNVNITVTGANSRAGALVADASGNVTRVYATGQVSGAEVSGGLAGSMSGTITASYANVAVTVSGDTAGGLVGSIGSLASTITASYATGPVTGGDYVGGLVGQVFVSGNIAASYATGPVSGTGSNVGGLIGHAHASATITNSYYDTGSSGQSGGTGPKTMAELQSPTDATGIYANWSADDWDFGTASQYPAIKADFNGDNNPTWPEFGYQLREAPMATVSTDGTAVTVSWTPVVNTHWTPNPALTYQVFKGSATAVTQPGTSWVDNTFIPRANWNTQYRVAALLDGVAARVGGPDRLGAPQVTAAVAEDLDEADANVGGVTLTLSRPLLTGETVTATYDVTAQGGAATIDATDFNQSITFGSGGNNTATASGGSLAIPLTAKADILYEDDQSSGILVTITALKFRPAGGNADGSDDVDLLASLPFSVTATQMLGFAEDDVAPAGIVVTLNPDQVMEDAEATVTVTVAWTDSGGNPVTVALLTDVSVTVSVGAATDSATEGAGGDYETVGDLTLNLRSGSASVSGTFTVTPVNDDDSEPIEVITVQATAAGNRGTDTATLNLVDDDQPSVTFTLTPTTIAESGGSATLRAAITLAVSSVTTVTVSANPASAVQLSGTTLIIPAGQEDSSGSITVTAIDNDVDAADATVTLSGTVAQSGITAPLDVTLTITDDDARGVTVSQTSRTVSENGGQATYTIRLNSQPTGTVTVTPQSSDTSVATVSGPLTFTTGNWQTPQPVTVTGVDDNVDNDGNQRAATITHTITGGDYGSVAVAMVSVNVNDDDATPDRIILTANPANVAEDAADPASVTITASFPQGSATRLVNTSVTVSRTGGTATSGTDYAAITPASVTITIPAGSTSAKATTAFSVNPINDDDSEGRETIEFGAASPPAGFTVTPAVFTINDDDISAMIESTNPSPLTERTLEGARLTVDLSATEYVSALSPAHFDLQPDTARLSIASVNRESNTRAVLTLAFSGDIGSDLGLKVHVRETANEDDAMLITNSVAVTQAPTPDPVMGVTATPGPGSLTVTWNTVDHADGYVVEWWRVSDPDNASSRRVADGSTTRTTIGDLLGETEYMARVYATSNFAPDGPPSAETATTTMPAHAIVSATNPSPLTENNLDGATVTVDLLTTNHPYRSFSRRWTASEFASYFTLESDVPGVSIAGVSRVSDTRAEVTLAYDVNDPSTDFDVDETLLIRIAWPAIEENRDISAVTTVKAVVEPPPGQVQNVRLTPGPRRITVTWDGAQGATGYRVQWRPSGQDWWYGYLPEARGQQHTIPGLTPGAEYDVRVYATKKRAPDGDPSAAATATTPAFRVRIGGTEPERLTEANLKGAKLIVDMEGAEWALHVEGLGYRFRVDGVPGVFVDPVWGPDSGVERVSASRVKVILGYRGEDFDQDATLRLRIFAHTHSWTEDITLTTPVQAVNEELMNVRAAGGDRRVDVFWDEIDGASAYRLEWKETGVEGYSGKRAVVTPTTWFPIRELKASTQYTVRVAAFVRYKGYGDWVEAEATTNPAPAQPKQTASVKVTAANPVAVTEGSTATYTVVLDGQPTGNVVIAPSSDNGDVTTQPASLTFTPDNWQTAQTVTVRAAHDDDAADDAATISHAVSGADGYAGIDVATVSVSVSDDDTAGVAVMPTVLSLNEGGSATYTVVLDTRPIGNVLISVFTSDGVTVQPGSLTFTPGNWRTPQTVTVSAPHDDDTEDGTAAISHGIGAGPDSGYAGVDVPNLVVSITDDDEDTALPAQQEEPGSVTVSEGSRSLREGDPAATYTVTLDVEPTENVTITVSSDNGDVTTQPASLTFTTGNWQTAQTVTVSAGEDADKADDTATITHSASGGNYDGVMVPSVAVSVTDDDTTLEALRDFYNTTDGANWTDNANWLSNLPLSEWHGITVNEQGEVTALALRDNNLTGPLPPELGKLQHLEVLSLDRNSLSDSLPSELGNLSNLTRLALNRNSLTGAIPSELGSLSNLSILGLARNSLSGPLPASLGNLSALTRLSLHNNTGLSGGLPSGFGSMSGLVRLAVSRTGLSGNLPQGLVNNTVMQYLHFDGTSLCAPANEEFQTWLESVPDKNGPTCE